MYTGATFVRPSSTVSIRPCRLHDMSLPRCHGKSSRRHRRPRRNVNRWRESLACRQVRAASRCRPGSALARDAAVLPQRWNTTGNTEKAQVPKATRTSVALITARSRSDLSTPRCEHPDCGKAHDRGREPAHKFEPRRHHEISHDVVPACEQHHRDHDRHRNDAINDGAPEQCLYRIDRREI